MNFIENKNIFWDYDNIDLNTELGLKIYLKRIISFWQFGIDDLLNIKKHYKDLELVDYWVNYFNFYFSKYDIN